MKNIIKGVLTGVFLLIVAQKTYASDDDGFYTRLLEHENRIHENRGGAQREEIAKNKLEEKKNKTRQMTVELIMEREQRNKHKHFPLLPKSLFRQYRNWSLDEINGHLRLNEKYLESIGSGLADLHGYLEESQQLRKMPPTRETLQRIWELEGYISSIESQYGIHHGR